MKVDLGQQVKTSVKPLDRLTRSRTLGGSPNSAETLQNRPIQKLYIFSRDTTFLIGGISNFEDSKLKNSVKAI
jgi:hypothetical protein